MSAQVAGARVDGVTLSEEQLAVAQRRARTEGLEVDFRLQDYREIGRDYDRIVSVGMFEHVGVNHYDAFFRKAATMLRPDGVMLLHTPSAGSIRRGPRTLSCAAISSPAAISPPCPRSCRRSRNRACW